MSCCDFNDFIHAMADETRQSILRLLQEGEMSVNWGDVPTRVAGNWLTAGTVGQSYRSQTDTSSAANPTAGKNRRENDTASGSRHPRAAHSQSLA